MSQREKETQKESSHVELSSSKVPLEGTMIFLRDAAERFLVNDSEESKGCLEMDLATMGLYTSLMEQFTKAINDPNTNIEQGLMLCKEARNLLHEAIPLSQAVRRKHLIKYCVGMSSITIIMLGSVYILAKHAK